MRLYGEIDTLLRSFARTMKEAVARGENRLLKGHPVFTIWNAARVLALAVLLSIGAVMYFNMASDSTNTEAHPRVAAPSAVDSETALARYMLMSGDDQWRYSFQHEPVASASPEAFSTAHKFSRGIADEHIKDVPTYAQDVAQEQKPRLATEFDLENPSEDSIWPVHNFESRATPRNPCPNAEYIYDDELWVSPFYEDFSAPHHFEFTPTEDWESEPLYSQCGTAQAQPNFRSSFAERFPNGSLSED